jgi:uncharacterized protein (DUF2147 family)
MIRFINFTARPLAFALFMLAGTLPAAAQSQADYHGLWWNEDRTGIVELVATESGIEGITRWGKKPDTDRNNPNPALRNRSLKGITFLWGFTYDEKKNRWKDGKVYDPDNGKTYDAKLSLAKGGTILKMRGYIGVSLFGRTAEFERVLPEEMPTSFERR